MARIDVDAGRDYLFALFKKNFGDRKDLQVEFKKPKGKQVRLDIAPNKKEGLHISTYSLRSGAEGLVSVPVSRAHLSAFKKLEATVDKVYKKLTGKKFKFGEELPEEKAKELKKRSSLIDYPRQTLSTFIWENVHSRYPRLKERVKWFILNNLFNICRYHGFRFPSRWIYRVTITGSLATNMYHNETGLDINVEIDYGKFIWYNRELDFMHPMDLRQFLRRTIYKLNYMPIPGSQHGLEFFVISRSHILETDAMYDVVNDWWIIPPAVVPIAFDPDKAFWRERDKAVVNLKWADDLLSKIANIIRDLSRIENFIKESEFVSFQMIQKKNYLDSMLRKELKKVRGFEDWLRDLRESIFRKRRWQLKYPAYQFSKNWAEQNIIYKYLEKYDYSKLVDKLFRFLGERDLIDLAKRKGV